jgi:hypothetical protein
MTTIRKAQLIAVVPGSAGKHYEIRVGADGIIYCTCRGWTAARCVPKQCKHLRKFLVENTTIFEALTINKEGRYVLED